MRRFETVDVTVSEYGHRTHESVSRFLRQHGIHVKNVDLAHAFDLLAIGLDPEGVRQTLRLHAGTKGAQVIAKMALLIREGKHLVTKEVKP